MEKEDKGGGLRERRVVRMGERKRKRKEIRIEEKKEEEKGRK